MFPDPVIEPDALPSLGTIRLLDVRAPEAFIVDHSASAHRVPVAVWEAAAKAKDTDFENIGFWEQAIADLGLDNRLPAIVCDDGRMTEAARVWFILQYFGADAHILNGGWPALRDTVRYWRQRQACQVWQTFGHVRGLDRWD